MFAYRPPIESKKLTLFNEVFNTLNKAVNKNASLQAILTLISLIVKWIQAIT